MGEEVFIVPIVVIGLPWLIFHYITKWKTAASLTREDENLLDELHDLARRLDQRLDTVERLVALDNPNWKTGDLEGPAAPTSAPRIGRH